MTGNVVVLCVLT